MATAIINRITDNLLESLGSVSTGGGYSVNFTAKGPDYVADSPSDGLCIVNDTDFTEEDNPPLGMDGYYQNYDFTIYVRPGDASVDFSSLCRQYYSDAKRAVMQDESRGGLARWSKMTGGRKFDDGALRGITASYQVYYRTLKDKPDQQ